MNFTLGWGTVAVAQVASPTLQTPSVNVNEGSMATFTATLDSAAVGDVTFTYRTADQALGQTAATALLDYTPTLGTATILSGATSTTISVQTQSDAVVESSEKFDLWLENLSPNAQFPMSALSQKKVGTIVDIQTDPNALLTCTTVGQLNCTPPPPCTTAGQLNCTPPPPPPPPVKEEDDDDADHDGHSNTGSRNDNKGGQDNKGGNSNHDKGKNDNKGDSKKDESKAKGGGKK